MTAPALIACSHGTRSPEGRAAITALVAGIRILLPEVAVVPAFVDVEEPRIDEVVDRVAASGPAVVVPLLLSTGFHTGVDIAGAVRPHPHVVAAPPLGPHALLVDVLAARLVEAGLDDGDAVVLAAAGSSDPSAETDVLEMAGMLAARLRREVRAGFAAGTEPRIDHAVAAARTAGARRVVAASYVLAPGHFARVIAAAGADRTTTPLAPDTRLAQLAAERYRIAGSTLPASVSDMWRRPHPVPPTRVTGP